MIDYDKLKAAAGGDALSYAVLRDVLEELANPLNEHDCPMSNGWGKGEYPPCNTCIVCLAKRWAEEKGGDDES